MISGQGKIGSMHRFIHWSLLWT